jgi:formylglycine-generating enzyme required for sulfatase activity
MMGAAASEKEAGAEEHPQHRVRLARPFLIGRFEVTFREWDACRADGGCSHAAEDFDWGRDERPVVHVSWEDAREYLAWLARKTGKAYRLPTEAEWEHAARAGTGTRYWWGDQAGNGKANCKGCGSQWDGRQTAPVGSFPPNPLGLHDTSGNVWEWVEDCWSEDFRAASSDGKPPAVEGPCGKRVLRGGSFVNKPGNLRSSARAWGDPDGRVNILGFRVARDP